MLLQLVSKRNRETSSVEVASENLARTAHHLLAKYPPLFSSLPFQYQVSNPLRENNTLQILDEGNIGFLSLLLSPPF